MRKRASRTNLWRWLDSAFLGKRRRVRTNAKGKIRKERTYLRRFSSRNSASGRASALLAVEVRRPAPTDGTLSLLTGVS